MGAIKIYGHRGALHFAPENTLTSFQLASDMGADGVEFDIQLTKGGEVVVCHDETLDRTSTGNGFLRDYTLEELRHFNFNKRGLSEPKYMAIPTLRETLELLALPNNGHLDINIELKTGIYNYCGIEQKAFQIVREYGLNSRVVWSSFNHISVQKIKEIDNDARTALLCGGGILVAPQGCAAVGAEALHAGLAQLQLEPSLAEQCRKEGVKLRVWTCDEADDLRRVTEAGVDAVFTNRIDTAKQIRSEFA